MGDNPTVAHASGPPTPKAPADLAEALCAKAGLVGVFLLGCAAMYAQDPRPSFEVASIRPAAPRPAVFMPGAPGSPRTCPVTGCGGPGTSEPGRITFINASLRNLIRVAYNLELYQLEAPGWLESARFDVIATLHPGSTRDEANLMLQNLLADRFQLKLHRETRELAVYALLVAQGGAKLKRSDDPNAPSAVARGRGTIGVAGPRKRFEFDARSMAQFANTLANEVDRPVIDRTGLTGQYDIRLDFAPPKTTALSPDPQTVDLFTALTEQLGLKLEPSRGPVVLLVVDSVSKQPTEN